MGLTSKIYCVILEGLLLYTAKLKKKKKEFAELKVFYQNVHLPVFVYEKKISGEVLH